MSHKTFDRGLCSLCESIRTSRKNAAGQWECFGCSSEKNPNPSKEKEEAGIPEEIPKMNLELSAQSDIAAIEYGKHCDRFIGERPYDGSHITEAHEQGQIWMCRQLQSQLSSITEELRVARANEESYKKWMEEARDDRDAALKEVGDYRNAVSDIFLFIEDSGEPIDGFRFRDCIFDLKKLNAKYKKEEQK